MCYSYEGYDWKKGDDHTTDRLPGQSEGHGNSKKAQDQTGGTLLEGPREYCHKCKLNYFVFI